jgi:hypothetical protein
VKPLAEGGPTSMENLARLCPSHHHMKTYLGYRLKGRPGEWRWVAPKEAVGAAGRGPPYKSR